MPLYTVKNKSRWGRVGKSEIPRPRSVEALDERCEDTAGVDPRRRRDVHALLHWISQRVEGWAYRRLRHADLGLAGRLACHSGFAAASSAQVTSLRPGPRSRAYAPLFPGFS